MYFASNSLVLDIYKKKKKKLIISVMAYIIISIYLFYLIKLIYLVAMGIRLKQNVFMFKHCEVNNVYYLLQFFFVFV